MTRPKKQRVDYFPHDCKHGKTLSILQKRYGNDGYAAWFKILEILGSSDGHYIDCNDNYMWEFIASEILVEPDLLQKIVDLIAKLGAIDAGLWSDRIIWSDNFVKRISDAYRNRVSEIPVRPDFLRKKPTILHQSDVGNPQTKLKESKLKEKKLIASPESPTGDNGDARPAFFCPSFEIDKAYFDKLLADYPALTENILSRELNKMGDWLTDNPKKHKRTARGHIKNPKLFIRNWIERMDIKPDGGKAWFE